MGTKLAERLRSLKIMPFRRKPDRFIKRLIEQATLTVAGCEALMEYMAKPSKKNAQVLRQAEKDADEIRRILIDELLRTFITPIDREDIYALSRAIDDIVDYAYSTVDEMDALDVEPNEYLRRMASLLRDAAEEIRLAMERLEEHPNVAAEHAQRAKALENRIETVYREAIAELFHRPQDVGQIVEMLKLREIYRHMSNAADRGDEAANLIDDVLVKLS
jgi:predicted phosphate transport protein (TIGR00153 family)